MRTNIFVVLVALVLLLPTDALSQPGTRKMYTKEENEIADAWVSTLPEVGADYGLPPQNYERLIKQYMERYLKDPDSAKYRDFTKPKMEHMIISKFEQKAAYGYSVCVDINSKNSFGGYSGFTKFWFFIRNDEILAVKDTSKPLGRIIYLGRPVTC